MTRHVRLRSPVCCGSHSLARSSGISILVRLSVWCSKLAGFPRREGALGPFFLLDEAKKWFLVIFVILTLDTGFVASTRREFGLLAQWTTVAVVRVTLPLE